MDAYVNLVAGYLLAQSWQIALLAAVVGLVSFALSNRSAHIRYLLWLVVLAKCLVPPLYSVPVAILPGTLMHPVSPEMGYDDVPATETGESMESGAALKPQDSGAMVSHGSEVAVLVWSLGVLLFLLWVGIRAVRYTLWLYQRRRPFSPALQQTFQELFASLRLRKSPRIWLTRDIGQPFVWGLLRGSIYLPVDFVEVNGLQHCRTILAHELSHISRFDAGVNLLQVAAQAIYWFHPLVWWANRRIRLEREKCCDEMVVAQLSTPPEQYFGAIVETLATERRSARSIPSLAIVGSLKDIEERIKTMLRPGRKFYKRPSPIVLLSVVLVALLAVPTALVLTARGRTRPAEPAAPTAPQADATLQNGDKPAADPWGWQPRYAARTFNSPMAFRVWVMVNYSGTRVVGNTPGATPLEIPPCWCWGVYTRSPVKDWDLLAREISLNKIPGLSLDSCTDSDLKHLAGLRDLRILHLPETAITDAGLESLEGLAELEDLGLENTPVTDAGLAHLKGLTNLRVLYLAKTRITDAGLQYLKGLTDLWGLILDGTQITDAGLQHLAGLTELGWLRLNGTRVTDAGLEHLKGLTALRALQLGDTQVTARGFAHLKTLPRLEDVSLNSRAITDDADLAKLVDALPRLTWLNLGGSQITDAGLVHVKSLTGLHHLTLGETQITDAGLANIGSLTELQYLRLGKTRITDAGLEHLKGLPKLWALGLEGTQITDAGLEHLQALKGLRKLYLNDTRIGDAGLEHLQGLTELVELYVTGTQITDAGLEHLKGLTKLGELSLVRTRITDGGLKYLQGLTELRGLWLIETQVTDAGARQLQQALPNLTIRRGPAQAAAQSVEMSAQRTSTPLHVALQNSKTETANLLISKAADVKAKDSAGNTPLHIAAQKGDKTMANLLILKGADVNAKNKYGLTPVSRALLSDGGGRLMVELLVSKGAKVSALHLAAHRGDIDKVRSIVDAGTNADVRDEAGHTPLFYAASAGQMHVVEFLISKGADINAKDNRGGETPLFYAADAGWKNVIELLIAKGADVNARGHERSGALASAAWLGRSDVAGLLIAKGADVNARDGNGYIPLHAAAESGLAEIVKLLIAKGSNVDAKTEWGQTPLLSAILGGQIGVVEVLIANEADVNAKDNYGQTPLRLAQKNGRTEIVELLKKHEAKE